MKKIKDFFKKHAKASLIIGALALAVIVLLAAQAIGKSGHLASLSAEAKNTNCIVGQSTYHKKVVDVANPYFCIHNPENGKIFDYGQTITVQASGREDRTVPISDNGVAIMPSISIALSVDGAVIVSGHCAGYGTGGYQGIAYFNYSCSLTSDLTNLSSGQHTVSATEDGAVVSSITVTVRSPVISSGVNSGATNRQLCDFQRRYPPTSPFGINDCIHTPTPGQIFSYGQEIVVSAEGGSFAGGAGGELPSQKPQVAIMLDGTYASQKNCELASTLGMSYGSDYYYCKITSSITTKPAPGSHIIRLTENGVMGDEVAISVTGSNSGSASGPVISSFTVSPTSVAPGQSVTLSWEVSDPDAELALTTQSPLQGMGLPTRVTGQTSITYQVNNPGQYQYSLSATNAAGSNSKIVSVTVSDPGCTTNCGGGGNGGGLGPLCSNDGVLKVCAPAITSGTFTITATVIDGSKAKKIFINVDGVRLKICNNVSSCTYDATVYSSGPHPINAQSTHPGGDSGTINVTKQ